MRFGHVAASGVSAGLRDAPTVPELAQIAGVVAPFRVLVSNEFLSAWPDEYTEALARDLRGIDVRIVVYTRAYPDWVASAYAQAITNGDTRWDFPTYLAWVEPRISFRPMLACYARCFGWPRIDVRSIETAQRSPGGLAADFCESLGLPAPPGAAVHENIAPPWPVLEMLRRRVPHDMDEAGWTDMQRPAIAAWQKALTGIATQHGHPPLRYGTAAERTSLAVRFEEDRAWLAACGMATPKVDVAPATEPPDLARASPALRAALLHCRI